MQKRRMLTTVAVKWSHAYSYGTANDNWRRDVSTRHGLTVHQYECNPPNRPVCKGGRFVFHDECVGAKAETADGQRFDTIASHTARNRDTKRTAVMTLDADGGEYPHLPDYQPAAPQR